MAPLDPSKLTKNELLKERIPTLAGNIAATLADPAADKFSEDDEQFIKFHGIYQQDDRDLRKTGKKYQLMIRGRIPGGVMTSSQWQVFDDLANTYGNQTLRVTTRQSIQFHGVVMSGLGPLIKKINQSLLSTLAACGDVNRNVTSPPSPAFTHARNQVFKDCVRVADVLSPITRAYHAIWVEGVQLDLEDKTNTEFVDPLYGRTYLPRKFKAAFVIPPTNDVDILTNDLGFIAIIENDKVIGYNLSVGGGMGRSHNNKLTFPRLANVIGFITPDQLEEIAKAVLIVHRVFGDRTNRKHARLKYIVEEKGTAWIINEIKNISGITLQPIKPYLFKNTNDSYGWGKAVDGSHFLTLYVSMGRIKDADDHRLKSALRAVAEKFSHIEFRLTANQNVILANIPEADKEKLNSLLKDYGVKTENQTSILHGAAMACPALPTCGLALAESERMLPALITRIDSLCKEVGISGEEIIIRSTGCPNGCARPYIAEIAFVGKAPNKYQLWLGGNVSGTRLNKLFKETVIESEIENELRPLFIRFRDERQLKESFGDFAARTFTFLDPFTNSATKTEG
jgi:sulfite reductase (NADPH) hemoprotein beta-component